MGTLPMDHPHDSVMKGPGVVIYICGGSNKHTVDHNHRVRNDIATINFHKERSGINEISC